MSKVLLLTGPPGAGKSTAAAAFTAQSKEVWASIDQDEIRAQVKAGFKSSVDPWDDETQKQWDVSIDICANTAERYQAVGINCFIDCSVPPQALKRWQRAFALVAYQVVVLLPDAEVAIARNNQRSGRARLREEQVRQHHGWFSGYINDDRVRIIDPSTLSVDEVVRALRDVLSTNDTAQMVVNIDDHHAPN